MRIEKDGHSVYIHDWEYDNIIALKEMIQAKYDGVFAVDGMEGTGKSEKAFQWALIQSEFKFTEEDVIYTPDQFEAWIKTAKPGSVAVWDEFVLAGMSTDALTKMQNTIIKQFTIMRSKQLTVILVIPYFFMLRKYFAIARTRFMIHVYSEGVKRGFFRFYDYNQKHWIYNYGQKTWFYNKKIKPAFTGRFEVWSHLFLDHKKIADKKEAALQEITEDKEAIRLTPREVELLPACINNIYKNRSAEKEVIYALVRKIKKKQGKK